MVRRPKEEEEKIDTMVAHLAVEEQTDPLAFPQELAVLSGVARKDILLRPRSIQHTFGIQSVHHPTSALILRQADSPQNPGEVTGKLPEPSAIRPRFVAEFIGESNFFEGEVVDARNSGGVVRTPAGLLLQSAASAPMARGERVLVVVRPERIRVVRDAEGTAANHVRGRIEHISYSGASTRYLVRLQTGQAVLVDVPAPTHGLGEMVSLTWEAERSRIVQENGSAGGTT